MKGRQGALVVVVVVMLAIGVAQTSLGHSILKGTGMVAEPPSYSELKFTDAVAIPKIMAPGTGPVNVSFDVGNPSGSAESYQWSILLIRSATSNVQASGAVNIPAQGDVSIKKTISVACTVQRVQIEVRLASPAESIDFWLACRKP